MKLWIDADAAPRDVKEIAFRAAKRLELETVLVANQRLPVPPGNAYVSAVRVEGGPDVADRYIVEGAEPGDVAVTADIPLAARVLERGAVCLDFRGGEFSSRTIGDAVAMRELHRYLRDLGELSGGPAAFSPRDRSRFASKLDAVLARLTREARQ